MTKFIALVSSKGGVGKTTIAVNLATALMQFGREVVLVDANLANPNIALHLGSPKLPATLHDALAGTKHIREVAYLHPSGLKVIPASLSWQAHADPEKLHATLLELIGTAELVLMDTATGMGKNTRAALETADESIIVTTPDLPAVTDAIRTSMLCEQTGCNILGIIVNRFAARQEELTIPAIEAMLERPVLGVIPEEEMHRRALALQHPLQYTHPESAAAVEFRKLAARLLGQNYQPKL